MTRPNRPTILLVDDSEDDLGFLRLALRKVPDPGCEALTARDGQEGLDLLANPPSGTPRADLVVVDLKMPRLDGRGLLRSARAIPDLAAMPIVVLSTSAAAGDIDACYRDGCNAYYQKPLTFTELERLMLAIVDHWFDRALITRR